MAQYGVAAYLCGHEHNLQHLTVPGQATHYIVSGGGSQVSPAGSEGGLRPEVQLFHAGSGEGCSLAAWGCAPGPALAHMRSWLACDCALQLWALGLGLCRSLGPVSACTCPCRQHSGTSYQLQESTGPVCQGSGTVQPAAVHALGICHAGFVEAMVMERELHFRFFSHLSDDPIYSISIP